MPTIAMTVQRLTAVLTHPVQYFSPWFRHLAENRPEIDLTVLYAVEPTPAQQGLAFQRDFTWDLPLREGYKSRVLRETRRDDRVVAGRFLGVDAAGVGRALDESRPDVALLFGWHAAVQLRALWHCRRRGIPLLYRGDSNLDSGSAPLRSLRTRTLLRQFSAYLCVGTRARDYLRRMGAAEERLFDSPHFVDNARFAAAAAAWQAPDARLAARAGWQAAGDELLVLYVGRLAPSKRIDDLLRGLAQVPRARLLVVGSGSEQARLQALAQELRVPATWAGFVNQGELGRVYAAADCLVLPSDSSETWGLVVNEAMATGLPAVVSDAVGCAPDLVTPGETGERFPMGDVAGCAAALERLRRRKLEGHDFAAACRARVARFSVAAASEGLVRACRSVARPHPRVIALFGQMTAFTGQERMNFEVLRVLRERGAAVHCVVNGWSSTRIVEEARAVGATWSTGYYYFPLDRHTRNPVKLAQMAWDVTRTSGELLRDARRFDATHVLVPEFLVGVRNAPALARLHRRGVRVIMRVGVAALPGRTYRFFWRRILDPVIDRYLCNSRYLLSTLAEHQLSQAKCGVIFNTAATRANVPIPAGARDRWRLIYVGQVIPEKGVHLLLDAIALVRARGLPATLDVVGTMEGWVAPAYEGYREKLLARAAAPDLTGAISFLGWREDVPALLARASLHVCPSLPEQREGFAGVVAEAKQAGVPSVVFPTGSLPELIDHAVDGWICGDTTAESLAQGIAELLRDPDRLAHLAAAARASSERYSRDRFAGAWWSEFAG